MPRMVPYPSQQSTRKEIAVTKTQQSVAQETCEKELRRIKQNYETNEIWPSAIPIAKRFLDRGAELKDVYQELYDKLHRRPPALPEILEQILLTTAEWHPVKVDETRDQRADLLKVNRQIAEQARKLAHLLRKRGRLENASGFSSNTHYHVLDVIEKASARNGLFCSHVREKLESLRRQYDLKYWPPLANFVDELSADAAGASVEARDPVTEAATRSKKRSLADYLRALFASIEEHRVGNGGFVPAAFRMTDRTVASIVNCALDLGPDELIDEAYVKRFRQGERERAAASR